MALSIENINEQFITLGTEDYDLVIDIDGDPDTVDPTGHLEGFTHHWDAANGRLHIKSDEVTRLLSGVHWNIKAVKNLETLTAQIAYNVIAAAPILETLGTIHLYRGVDINFDIVIQNIPPAIIPNARLIGLKSELLEYGLNIKGRISTTDNFTSSSGDIRIIIPAETGGEDTVYQYPYHIEPGSPPVIGTVTTKAKGNFSEIAFTDVTHALGYEWTLEAGDDATWNFFSTDRNVINPSEIKITPGNLNVTITFPNIPGASSYAYRLESENHEVDWTDFVGTLESGMITTIIPGLEDGVEYILRLRVASPWIGVPVPVTVVGGRTCYTLHIDRSANAEHYLYLFHTGHPNATQATRIKRLRLPSSLSEPDAGGLAVNSDGDVFILNMHDGVGNEKALYTFLADTIANAADGSQLIQDRKNPFSANAAQSPTTTSRLSSVGMAEYNNELYIYFRTANHSPDWRYLNVIPVPTMDGAELTQSRKSPGPFNKAIPYGLSVDAERIWYRVNQSGGRLGSYDRELFSLNPILNVYLGATGGAYQFENSFKILDNKIYNLDDGVTDRIDVFSVNPEIHATRHVRNFYLILPTGLTNPRFLDILT